MAHINHPVGYTCPAIDEAINSLGEIADTLHNVADDLKEVVKEEYIKQIVQAVAELETLYEGSHSKLEKLRESNDALRNWGDELYSERDCLEKELKWAQEEVTQLKYKVEDLQDELDRVEV